MNNKFFTLLILISVVFGCTKKPVDQELSNNNFLKTFQIEQQLNQNKGLKENALVNIIDGIIYITVNEGADLSSLIPTISSGKNATFFIDDRPIVSATTPANLKNTAELAIKAENGGVRKYYICAKNGNKTIDAAVYNLMSEYNIPGISVSATKNEVMAYSYGYGFANKSTRERVTPKHLFRLASISKSQTALCLMTLMEQGKLKITDRLFGKGGLFETEFGIDLLPGTETITIQNFLEHTSGWSGEHIFTYGNDPLNGKNLQERINYVLHNIPLNKTPGTAYAYYNLGFGVLGMVVEKISGKEYEKYLREDVYAKAGVTNIWVGGDMAKKRKDEVVYYSQDGTNGYGNDMQLIKALGGLIASTEELMKVMASIDYGTLVPDILKPETLSIMYTPSKVYPYRYCLGWRTNHSFYTNWEAYHGGNLAGTGTFWCRSKTGTSAVVLCNSRSYKDNFDTALYDLLALVQNNI